MASIRLLVSTCCVGNARNKRASLTRDRWSDANGVGIRGTVRLGNGLTIESREEVVGHAGSAGSLADNFSLDDSIKRRSPRKSLSDA